MSDEGGFDGPPVNVLDKPPVSSPEFIPVQYVPSVKEQQLNACEIQKLHMIDGSPRIWWVDIDGTDAGIFKSKFYKGEINSDVEHERAAYLISDILGFDFVPTTVLKTIDGKEGCLQEYVEDTQDLDEVDESSLQDELYKYWIFRHLLRNPDGHNFNLLVKEGKIISIDHEASFDSDTPDPSYYDIDRSYYGIKAPESLKEIFNSYLRDEAKQAMLKKELTGLISPHDTEVTLQRIKKFGYQLAVNGQINDPSEITGENLW